MTAYFLDSSALVKRYVTEIGTIWIRTISSPSAGHTILVAQITPLKLFLRWKLILNFWFQDCRLSYLFVLIRASSLLPSAKVYRHTFLSNFCVILPHI